MERPVSTSRFDESNCGVTVNEVPGPVEYCGVTITVEPAVKPRPLTTSTEPLAAKPSSDGAATMAPAVPRSVPTCVVVLERPLTVTVAKTTPV